MTSWRALLQKGMRSKGMWGALAGAAILMLIAGYALYGMFRGDAQGLTFAQLRAQLTPALLLQAALAYALDLALAITGWVLIIGTLSGVWRWREHVRIYCINSVTRRLPGSMWYLLGRVVMYERLGISRSLTLIASGIEYVATLLGGLLVAALAWPLVLSDSQISPLWLIGALILGVLFLNPLILGAIIKRLSPQTYALNLRYRHLIGWIAFYSLVWIGGGVLLFVLANAVHPLALATLPRIVGIWATAALLPQLLTFLPFGLGVQEVSLAALLAPLLGGVQAIVVALLMRVVLTLNELLWAGIAALIRSPRAGGPPEQALDPAAQPMTELLSEGAGKEIDISHSNAEKPHGVSRATLVIPPK